MYEPEYMSIYDRLADGEAAEGSVMDDIGDALDAGDFDAVFDYFGDRDPLEFL